jgi:hypothetical protein
MQGRRRALFIAVYVLFLFGLVEVTARVLFGIPALVPRLWVGDHTTWRRRWVQQRSADVAIYHSFDQFDSTIRWQTKPGLRDLEVLSVWRQSDLPNKGPFTT